MASKSDNLINELINRRLITVKPEDKSELKLRVQQHLSIAHLEAVQATVMASNRKQFIAPKFED